MLLASKVVDFLKKSREDGIIFKIDFEKVFDCVNWDYLLDIYKSTRFGSIWIQWISACLSSTIIAILINGFPTQELPMKRRIRQGDPLLPYLFNIAVEGLNILIKKAVQQGWL